MPETDTIPVSAGIASTGKGIRYIGSGFWAGFSGEITVSQNTNTNLLDFKSPAQGLNTILSFGVYDVDMDLGRRLFSEIKFNGIRILRRTTEYSPATGVVPNAIFDLPIYLIIPPLTVVEISVEHDDTTNIPFSLILTAEQL